MSERGEDGPVTWIDLALGQGLQKDLQPLRDRMATDPVAAVEFAETRDLVERFRELGCEPSAGFASRMQKLSEGTRRRGGPAQRRMLPRGWPLAAAAAWIGFALLAATDPLGLRRVIGLPVRGDTQDEPVLAAPQPFPTPPMPSTIAKAMDATQRFAPGSPLTDAWTRFSEAPVAGHLTEWVAPENAVSYLRLDRELRDTAELRRRALRDDALVASLSGRANCLAAEVAKQSAASDLPLRDLALALRALLGAGSQFDGSARSIVDRLQAGLPKLDGGDLAMALCALAEAAGANGRVDGALLRVHGDRLIAGVLVVGDEVWGRRRPRMLQAAEPAANLAAAGRFLRMAAAFGVDPTQARAVRLLMLGHLEERRLGKVETPDVPTAMAYGFQDLLSPAALAAVERSLRRWRPEALAPDYLSLQMFAATRRPDLLGFARWQLELRRVAALADPATLHGRAALSRCLTDSLLASAPRQELAGL